MRVSRVVVVLVAVVGVFVVCCGSAVAASPWWGLGAGTRPVNLGASQGSDEVQTLTISATEGDFWLEHAGMLLPVKFDATPAELQAVLGELYPSDRVEVTEGEGDATGAKPYRIVFPDQAVAPVTALKGFFGIELKCAEDAMGCTKTASLVESERGVASEDQVYVTAENLGDADANGGETPIRIDDKLPAGLRVLSVTGVQGQGSGAVDGKCSGASAGGGGVSCTFAGVSHPYEVIEVRVSVALEGGASSGVSTVSVSGGGAAGARTITRPVPVGGPARFGVQEDTFTAEREGGGVDTLAGSHPFQVTSTLALNQGPVQKGKFQPTEVFPVGLPKDLGVLSPAGLVGNPTPFERCTDQEFVKVTGGEGETELTRCPLASVIGVASVTIEEPVNLGLATSVTPVFNLVPRAGEPARFGFYAGPVPVPLDTSVRTGRDYGITVTSHNISQIQGLLRANVTLWGVPGDARHDGQRGYGCLKQDNSCPLASEGAPPPFLSMPTSCSTVMQSAVEADSWEQPKEVLTFPLTEQMPGLDGCNHLAFEPAISVAPDVPDGSTATGLEVKIHVPQTTELDPEGLAEGTVRDTTVKLPAGVTLNAGGADGLQACAEGQIGYLGKDSGDTALNLFTPILGEPFCPDASKVGTVEIETPLLPNKLEGAIYLASPAPAGEGGMNPFDSLLALYIVARDPVSGTLVKIPGKVVPDPVTGQITSTFEETPELPFENLRLHFFGGSRAPLATPAACGTYTTDASFTPWSLEEGSQPAQASSSFQITSGPNGAPCTASPRPFNPELHASTSNIQAGAFTPLVTTMGHPDPDQALGGLSLTFPPGLLGSLSAVTLCGEPQAAEGTCGPQSLIGHTTVTAGLGSSPAVVSRPGSVYITGPYHGAPYGLSIVNPAETGPFDLEKGTPCDCVVVRAKVAIDPHTAQLSVISDSLPTILQGVPLNLQHVTVTIDRPGFTFNPTNCDPMSISGTLSGAEGAVASVATPFQVTNCATLAFKPAFDAAVTGKTSKQYGAGLSVKLSYPAGSLGSEANIARVKVELPKQLPSRLTTLQKACLAATFDANPQACPPQSVIGHARVITPVLPTPLEGPAYFVSHGGEQFPDLTIVLHGYGVTIELVGSTFISKTGITSTTFKSPPDVPFNTFELTLPQGPYSALGANTDLCLARLTMPTEFKAQNGTELHQNTPIEPTGCPTHIAIASHKLKRQTLTLSVYAPTAGRLQVIGGGLGPTIKHAKGRETLVVTMKVKRRGKFNTKLRLTFTPKSGKHQSETLRVRA